MGDIYDSLSEYDKRLQLQADSAAYKKHIMGSREGRALMRSINNEMPFFDAKELEAKKEEGFIKPLDRPTVQFHGMNRVHEVKAAYANLYNYKNIYAPRDSRGSVMSDSNKDHSKTDKTLKDILETLTGKPQAPVGLTNEKTKTDSGKHDEDP